MPSGRELPLGCHAGWLRRHRIKGLEGGRRRRRLRAEGGRRRRRLGAEGAGEGAAVGGAGGGGGDAAVGLGQAGHAGAGGRGRGAGRGGRPARTMGAGGGLAGGGGASACAVCGTRPAKLEPRIRSTVPGVRLATRSEVTLVSCFLRVFTAAMSAAEAYSMTEVVYVEVRRLPGAGHGEAAAGQPGRRLAGDARDAGAVEHLDLDVGRAGGQDLGGRPGSGGGRPGGGGDLRHGHVPGDGPEHLAGLRLHQLDPVGVLRPRLVRGGDELHVLTGQVAEALPDLHQVRDRSCRRRWSSTRPRR